MKELESRTDPKRKRGTVLVLQWEHRKGDAALVLELRLGTLQVY
jgi:hypothetical protein